MKIRTAREAAFSILQKLDAIGAGNQPAPIFFAGEALDDLLKRGSFSREDRALATELLFGVLRQRRLLDWSLKPFSRRPLEKIDPSLLNILRIAAYQLLFLDRIPPFAAINEAVEMAKYPSPTPALHKGDSPSPRGGERARPALSRVEGVRGEKGDGSPGFVNAVLRALTRGEEAIPAPEASLDPIEALAVRHSHPDWLVRRWVNRYGLEKAGVLLAGNNELPPLTLRIHTLVISREAYLQTLENAGLEAVPCRYSPEGVRILSRTPIETLPGLQEGWFYVQDEGAQLLALALAPRPGETVLDACAAPGGKTTHLAALIGETGRIIACDVNPRRLKIIEANLKRLNLPGVELRLGDLAENPRFAGEERFDRILVDAPCSGLGTLRRHPEGRWTKTPKLITHYAAIQSRILDHAAVYLKPGGFLLYATCSTEPEENEERIAAFLSDHPEFEGVSLRSHLPEPAAGLVDEKGFLHTEFADDRMDGFFAAGLRKR